MDEVMPVARFLALNDVNAGFISFPLSERVPPDCFLWKGDDSEPRLIEVTVTLAEDRFHDMSGLVAKGEIHKAYSTEEILLSTIRGIRHRLERKDQKKYSEMDLLISGPLNVETLPYGRWGSVRASLLQAVECLPFREIHVIGDDTNQPIGFRIK